jgi:4-diphosphocytidyl-2-C-methyl-D-erythritol kinase
VIRLQSSAKINLGLRVFPRREDGFHPIETLFFRISILDQIEICEAPALKISCSNPKIPTNSNNLVWKAYQLAATVGNIPPCHIHLHKTIPIGAGLGGGSSNATRVFKHLVEQYNLSILRQESVTLLAEIGSDLPFFLEKAPCFGSGKGEKLQPIDPLPVLKICLVLPEFEMSTPQTYLLWDQSTTVSAPPYPLESVVEDLRNSGGENLSRLISNDLQKPLEKVFPEFLAIKKALEDSGAYFVSLTGSGSAMYGLYSTLEHQDRAYRTLQRKYKAVFRAQTLHN